jgi:hypothetical protein
MPDVIDLRKVQEFVDSITQKPELEVDDGNLPETAEALRELIVASGKFYDRDGPALVINSANDGSPIVTRMSIHTVVRQAHKLCKPVKHTRDGRKYVTLPNRVAQIYLDMNGEWRLAPLDGVSTAPLLSEDGTIRWAEGYDQKTRLWCSNIPKLKLPTRPSPADAEAALTLIRENFCTFPFGDANRRRDEARGIEVIDMGQQPGLDESAFILALLTAACRPSLWLTPGFLFTAPSVSGAGSGKGLLVRAICAIAFGIRPRAFTAGGDRKELDKRLAAELVEAQPALFLDNANGIALRSDTLASVLTERPSRVRILGETRMVMLNSTAFVATTGNGLTVTEDLARRFISCELDARCEDPESRPFETGFLEQIERCRTELLTAVLTIWRWGQQNQTGPKRGKPIGSYEVWAEWCRDPLLTLGCQDPVERIEKQKASDPRRQQLAELFGVWWVHHGAAPVSIKNLNDDVKQVADLQGRGRQYLAKKIESLAGTRAAGFVLTRQAAAGKWGAATYALAKTGDAIGHRAHRGHRPDGIEPMTPMTPMTPMPDAVDASDVAPGEEVAL